MDKVLKKLIESELASVEVRLKIAETNVDTLAEQLEFAEAARDELLGESLALRAALPAEEEEAA